MFCLMVKIKDFLSVQFGGTENRRRPTPEYVDILHCRLLIIIIAAT